MLSVGEELLRFTGRLLSQPFYYIGIVLLLLLYRKQGQHERFSFHVRKRSWIGKWIVSIGGGIVVGLLLTILFGLIGAQLHAWTVVWLWAIAGLLLLLRVRMFSFSYAIALLLLLHFGVTYIPEWFGQALPSYGWLEPLLEVDRSVLLLLAGIMLGIEAVLHRLQTSSSASPLYLKGKRGKPVGGFHLLQFWPVPLMLLVPAGSAAGLELSWTPLLSESAGGWVLLPLPLLLGYSSWTAVQLPEGKARKDSIWMLLISVVVIAAALGSVWMPWLAALGALLFLILREVLVWKSARDEMVSAPRFVHGADGLKVLDVIAGSPADKLGITAGEILYRVNGFKPNTVEELHAALQHNPAYCKLEVTNLQGESKFLKRAIFEGDHHLLGILLAPSDRSPALPVKVTDSLWRTGVK